MPWTTPKTDWAIQPRDQYGRYNGDWFNWQDYERIRENIEHLAELGRRLYWPFALEKMWTIDETVVAYPEYTGYTSGVITDAMRYSAPVDVDKQINPIERNLDILADVIYRPVDFPATKTWLKNGSTPTFDDLNRWETVLLNLYDALGRSMSFKMPTPMGLGKEVF